VRASTKENISTSKKKGKNESVYRFYVAVELFLERKKYYFENRLYYTQRGCI